MSLLKLGERPLTDRERGIRELTRRQKQPGGAWGPPEQFRYMAEQPPPGEVPPADVHYFGPQGDWQKGDPVAPPKGVMSGLLGSIDRAIAAQAPRSDEERAANAYLNSPTWLHALSVAAPAIGLQAADQQLTGGWGGHVAKHWPLYLGGAGLLGGAAAGGALGAARGVFRPSRFFHRTGRGLLRGGLTGLGAAAGGALASRLPAAWGSGGPGGQLGGNAATLGLGALGGGLAGYLGGGALLGDEEEKTGTAKMAAWRRRVDRHQHL